ncbi:MAG: flavodoxin-dependent (E)-4-hydroxy-3-methylbut-2-enyl-diphosphate synthase [Oscillospiraceae bacterium]|nr:flavodoxin-dependent (E)-4-hydroxy-3-methylbut-2-enyl-diphosphate synthase [Oscillospiraceae bacterium]
MRKLTRKINVGGVEIGGGAQIPVQSMLTVPLENTSAAAEQISALARAGCDIVRAAVPSEAAAEGLEVVRKTSPLPIVADIHFDWRLAIAAVRAGADKIRVNPGNIGGRENVQKVAQSCLAAGIPIRVGVNSGSVPKDILEEFGGQNSPQALVKTALRELETLADCGFFDVCLSVKSSSVPVMIESYRLLSSQTKSPLQLGVTEAGGRENGVIASSVGIGALLADGIGDTIRVSLTADPVYEVKAGISILRALGLREGGFHVISCPTCGRTVCDVIGLAETVEQKLSELPQPKKTVEVAVMGCAVNGPGEAKRADFGAACGDGMAVLFRSGEIVGRCREDEIVQKLIDFAQEAE